jgi:hypothetical protein
MPTIIGGHHGNAVFVLTTSKVELRTNCGGCRDVCSATPQRPDIGRFHGNSVTWPGEPLSPGSRDGIAPSFAREHFKHRRVRGIEWIRGDRLDIRRLDETMRREGELCRIGAFSCISTT